MYCARGDRPYVLLHALRRLGLRGTSFAQAQCSTIRLKLLKIAAASFASSRAVIPTLKSFAWSTPTCVVDLRPKPRGNQIPTGWIPTPTKDLPNGMEFGFRTEFREFWGEST